MKKVRSFLALALALTLLTGTSSAFAPHDAYLERSTDERFVTGEDFPEYLEEKAAILALVDPGMSDLEKALLVYDYFQMNYTYRAQIDGLNGKPTRDSDTAAGLLANRTGQCDSAARAYLELMGELGVTCRRVTGTVEGIGHAWNQVELDGVWYNVDATPHKTNGFYIKERTFLVSDAALEELYYEWAPEVACTDTRYEDAPWQKKTMYYLDGWWYYAWLGVSRYSFALDREETVLTPPDRPYTWGTNGVSPAYEGTWHGYETNVVAYGGKVYYHTLDELWSWDPATEKNELVRKVDWADYADCDAEYGMSGDHRIIDIRLENAAVLMYYMSSKGNSSSGGFRNAILYEFVPNSTLTISAASETGGAIFPIGEVKVPNGRSRTFRIVPADGAVIEDVLVDGKSVGAVERYVFRDTAQDHTIRALFRQENGIRSIRLDERISPAGWFSEGLCEVKVAEDGGDRTGCIDRSGRLLFTMEPGVHHIEPFKNGAALVVSMTSSGVIDRTGAYVVPQGRYDYIRRFSENLFIVTKGDLEGLVDCSGREVLHPTYDRLFYADENRVRAFPVGGSETFLSIDAGAPDDLVHGGAEALAFAVQGENGKYALSTLEDNPADRKLLTGYVYDALGTVYADTGLTKACRDGKYGYLNARGEEVIPCANVYLGDFQDCGLAVIASRYEDHKGAVDLNGNIVIWEQYAEMDDFHGGLTAVTVSEASGTRKLQGVINAHWDTVIPMEAGTIFTYGGDGTYFRRKVGDFVWYLLDGLPYSERVGLENFSRSGGSAGEQFRDVDAGSWYAPGVQSACELGLFNGKSDGVFDPGGTVTHVEAVKLSDVLHSVYWYGISEFQPIEGEKEWYDRYMDYAGRSGFLPEGPRGIGWENGAITRAEFAQLLDQCFPDKALPQVREWPDGSIPDVTGQEPYGPAVYRLYRAGILSGNSAGAFMPGSTITRAEAAAIVSRMADPALRQK